MTVMRRIKFTIEGPDTKVAKGLEKMLAEYCEDHPEALEEALTHAYNGLLDRMLYGVGLEATPWKKA
jgi:hypothetical protein